MIQNGEFQFGFLGFVKTVGFNGWKLKKQSELKNCKIELLEVLGHRGWIHRATEGFQGLFLALGRMTYSHLPNQIFI